MILGLAFYLFATLLLLASLGVILARNPVHGVLSLIVAFFNAAALFVLLGAEFLAMLLVIVYVGAVAVLFLFVVMMLDIEPGKPKRVAGRMKHIMRGVGALGYYMAIFVPLWLGVYALISWAPSLLSPDWCLWQEGLPLVGTFILHKVEVSSLALTASGALLVVCLLFAAPLARRWGGVSGIAAFLELLEYLPLSWMVGLLIVGELLFFSGTWYSSGFAAQSVNAPLPPTDLVGNTQALASLLYRYYVYVFQACGLVLLVAMIGAIVLTLRKKTTLRRQNILEQVTRNPKDCVTLITIPVGEGVKDV